MKELLEELLEELIEYAGADYDDSQNAFLSSLLEDALDEVVQEMYPYGFQNETQRKSIEEKALSRYKSKIKKIAEYHYDKQGKEGVTSYSENSTSTSYENSGTPSSYLRGIVPVAKII